MRHRTSISPSSYTIVWLVLSGTNDSTYLPENHLPSRAQNVSTLSPIASSCMQDTLAPMCPCLAILRATINIHFADASERRERLTHWLQRVHGEAPLAITAVSIWSDGL